MPRDHVLFARGFFSNKQPDRMEPKRNFKLITIPVSHYCEKARWALDHHKIVFNEDPHAPGFHRPYTAFAGGSSVPILVTDEKTYTDSRDIVAYVDTLGEKERSLYSDSEEEIKAILELEKLFDEKLGPSTRVLAYFYIFQDQPLAKSMLSVNLSTFESYTFSAMFGGIRSAMMSGMGINQEGADNALRNIDEVVNRVNDLMKDRDPNKDFLVGSRFSCADLTLASLFSPVILPSEMVVYQPFKERLPQGLLELSEKYQKTPCGQLALRMYREFRR